MSPNPVFKDHEQERRLVQRRLLWSVLLLLLCMTLLLGRIYTLQVVKHEEFHTLSDKNRIRLQPIPPTRGLIYDRNQQLLAHNKASFNLTLVKESIADLPQTLDRLTTLLKLTDEELNRFRKRLERSRSFDLVPLRDNLTEEEIAILALERHRLPGVEVSAQLVRHYPFGPLFAHPLGYVARINESELKEVDPVNYSGTEYIGKGGVERQNEALLHGQVGYQNVEIDARGRVIRVLNSTAAQNGADLTLYLDSHIQQVAEEALTGWRGAAVAIEISSGGVLAMVSTPSYDPNLFVTGIDARRYGELQKSTDLPLLNRAVRGRYPPGSTVKPFVALAGLQHQVINFDSTVADPGWYQLPGNEHKYRDWKKWGHGYRVGLRQAIVESCDTFFYDLAYRLNIDRLSDTLGRFGFGALSGAEFPGELPGILPSRAWKQARYRANWFPGETVITGIGQGYMTVTPLQLAAATATLANRGVMVRPRLVKSISPVDSAALLPSAPPPIQLAQRGYWDFVIGAMEGVVHDPTGTAKRIAVDAPYRIAGKSGTAQVVGIAQDEEYDAGKISKKNWDHALFIAFAPAEAPRIAVAVVVENGGSGSGTAAPIARRILDAYLLPRQP